MTTAANAHQQNIHFAQIPSNLTLDTTISAKAKLAYLVLAAHASYQTGKCWPSIGRIATLAGMGRESVGKVLIELEEHGWITRTVRRGQHGKWNGFTFTVHFEPHQEPDDRIGKKPSRPNRQRTKPKELQRKEQHAPAPDQTVTIPEASAVCAPSDDEKSEEPTRPVAHSTPCTLNGKRTLTLVQRTNKQAGTPSIDQAVLDSINAQLKEGLDKGTIRNAGGYRQRLLQLAREGQYILPGTTQASSSSRTDETRQWLDDFERERQAQTDEDRQAVKEMLARFNRKVKS